MHSIIQTTTTVSSNPPGLGTNFSAPTHQFTGIWTHFFGGLWSTWCGLLGTVGLRPLYVGYGLGVLFIVVVIAGIVQSFKASDRFTLAKQDHQPWGREV